MSIIKEETISKILSTKNPSNSDTTLLNWHIERGIVKAGNNYGSEVSRLIIEYEKNNEKQKMFIFLKVTHNTPVLDTLKKINFIDKEPYIYTELFPKMYTLYDEYFTPRSYHIDDKKSLFLKDLSQSGYKLANRVEQLDFEHCALAFTGIAKFHAFSVHLEKLGAIPDHIKQVQLLRFNLPDENWKYFFLSGPPKLSEILDGKIQQKYSQQLAHLQAITWQKLAQEAAPDQQSLNVLTHGNFTATNMMYKYDRYGNVKKIKLIDFQTCEWANPAMDILQFTITSMKFEVYEKYFDLLLHIYLDTLNKILSALDCGTYSMESLRNDIDKRYYYSTVMYTVLLPVMLADPDNPIALDDLVDEVKGNKQNKLHRGSRYIEVANKWFLHFAKKLENLSL